MNSQLAVVIVLYQQTISQSPSYEVLKQAIKEGTIYLVVYDNSSVAHEDPIFDHENVHYRHDPTNPGLAQAYNYGLSCVTSACSLVTLDQDTQIDMDYFDVVHQIEWSNELAAAVPRVFAANRQISPVLSAQYINRHFKVVDQPGIFHDRIMAINSGVVFSCQFLKQINGFNPMFPLDFLDHWMSWQIAQLKKEILVLDIRIEHDLSVLDYKKVSTERYRSILNAEDNFYQGYDRVHLRQHRKQLILRTIKQFLTIKNRGIWRLTLRSLVDNWKV